MVDLRPQPFPALLARMLHELHHDDAIFGLPRRRFFGGDEEHDLSVSIHGQPAGCSLGPAAGPHTQMAQNIVLAWLAGCRVFELKTVQINDSLVIPRPCIDMATVGYNVEWSQELRLAESLDEYVTAAMLIEVLIASGELKLSPSFSNVVYDMSVGYDLPGITSPTMNAFIDGLIDCSSTVERLRGQIPPEHSELRDLAYPTQLCSTLTLSTFHGCPPEQIEAITRHLLDEKKLHCSIKLNPLLLGEQRMHELLHERMGYTDVTVAPESFAQDATWDQATTIIDRLRPFAAERGLGLGVKLTNTLVVQNNRDFFPEDEKLMYLSGQPLHVLAMHLVRDVRRTFGPELPISFSAGVDKVNYPDTLALGLIPATVCTDLLRPGGYGRAPAYFTELASRMDAVGARDVDGWIASAYETGESEADRSKALVANTEHYVAGLEDNPLYSRVKTNKPPRKVGSSLTLFDCLNCDKCVPVCPNAANFTYELPAADLPKLSVQLVDGRLQLAQDGVLTVAKEHQLANFADFCNECGNCDIFCPEDGGPYIVKPRFFGSLSDWREHADHDGFAYLVSDGEPPQSEPAAALSGQFHGRIEGREYLLSEHDAEVAFSGPGFALTFALDHSGALREDTLSGTVTGEADLTWYGVMARLRDGVYGSAARCYVAVP
ncbi:MAG: putative selenate reductase [Pseudohongiellaceae bacterium]|jgi:putative selenate reductase